MTSERCQHGRKICSECIHVPDSAKRAYDIIRAYVTFVPADELQGKWVALRLADGGSDGTLYDSKRDAVRHQSDERLCAYFSYRHAPHGFKDAKDAAIWLEYHRQAYDAGFRLPDPDDMHGGPDLIMPLTNEDVFNQLGRLARGTN